MATAKQAQSRRTDATSSTRGRKAAQQASPKKSLREHYARLEKTQPGSEESKRISAQVVDAIG